MYNNLEVRANASNKLYYLRQDIKPFFTFYTKFN
jgi:hypothetical protein